MAAAIVCVCVQSFLRSFKQQNYGIPIPSKSGGAMSYGDSRKLGQDQLILEDTKEEENQTFFGEGYVGNFKQRGRWEGQS